MGILSTLFPPNLEKQERKRVIAEANEAIANFDAQALKRALASVEFRDNFFADDKNSPISKLLRQSIEIGDPDIFDALVDVTGPNYTVYEYVRMNDTTYTSTKSLLYYAIEQGSYDIAMSLVANPETNIDASGELRGQTFESPLERIKHRGMRGVEIALQERKAEMLMKQAESLRQGHSSVQPEPVVAPEIQPEEEAQTETAIEPEAEAEDAAAATEPEPEEQLGKNGPLI